MKVFVNPGHAPGGVPDPGAVGHGLVEALVAEKIGRRVALHLREAGREVYCWQSDKVGGGIGLSVTAEANQWDADCFVSIHANSAADSFAHGVETFCYSRGGAGEALAACIQSQMVEALPLADRGVKERPGLYVLSHTEMPAVLVEVGFLSNEGDADLVKARWEDMAAAIARGVTDWEQAVYCDNDGYPDDE